MRKEARSKLRLRYDHRCGYCGVSETDVGGPLTTDHFQPRSSAGNEDPDNLVYCCFTCNTHKGEYWSDDPDKRFLHPLNDNVSAHIRLMADGTLTGLTVRGQFQIDKLNLNRPELIAHRLALREQLVATENLRHATQELERLRQQVAELEQDLLQAERRLSSL